MQNWEEIHKIHMNQGKLVLAHSWLNLWEDRQEMEKVENHISINKLEKKRQILMEKDTDSGWEMNINGTEHTQQNDTGWQQDINIK